VNQGRSTAAGVPLGLDPPEAAGLVPTHITTQSDLNAWEQTNIVQGESWALRQKIRDLLGNP
jgi:hypothetical protein